MAKKKSSKRSTKKKPTQVKKRRKRRGGAEKLIADLRSKSAEMKAAIKDLEKQKAQIQKDADAAVADLDKQIGVLNSYLVRVGGGASSPFAKPEGRKKKATQLEIAAAIEKIMAVLPPKNTNDENCKGISQIAEETKLDKGLITSVLQRLKKENLAASNGVVGRGGGWRKA